MARTTRFRWFSMETGEPNPLGPVKCISHTYALTLAPAVVMLLILKKASTLRPVTTGILALTSSYALSTVIINFACAAHSPMHHLVMHFLPVTGIAVVGAIVGKKIFA